MHSALGVVLNEPAVHTKSSNSFWYLTTFSIMVQRKLTPLGPERIAVARPIFHSTMITGRGVNTLIHCFNYLSI